jgi:protein O-GlcNAc transferase
MAASRNALPSLERARELHQQGYLPEAEMLYREILERSPRNAGAMSLLGILRAQSGDPASALEWLGKAVAIDPKSAAYRFNFGKALLRLNRASEACEALERATLLDPGYADAHNELGLARAEAGALSAAEAAFRKALSIAPRHWEAHNNLGLLLHRVGRTGDAVQSLRSALDLQPRSPEVLKNLGMALRSHGRPEEAVQAYRAALELSPGDPGILTNLGNALGDLSRNAEAIACFEAALKVAPDYADALYNWGALEMGAARFLDAADKFRAALSADPHLADAEGGLASVLHDLGRIDEAIAAGRRALELDPGNARVHSQLLFSLLHSSSHSPRQVFDEHLEWGRRHAANLSPKRPVHSNAREPERRLRVGYVSGDFRHHSVAQFIEPVLGRHDRSRFEVFCYYCAPHADDVTERLRRRADAWRDIAFLKDDAVADLVRDDRIDILVDLSGHTRFNRLLVFAQRPAPVQVTWIGYLCTTGLDAMGYRISDGRATPEGPYDSLHTEHVVRLPDSLWCYQPPADCPAVGAPPSVREGRAATFGAFFSLAKIGPAVLALWRVLLERLPESRLLVVGLGLESVRGEYLARLAAAGIAPERVDLRGFQSFHDYLAIHENVDMMLDTFPYAGATTTCHALWMGVPVVSLAGDSYVSRVGASVLGAIGLGELLAETPEEYVEKARALAGDPARLSQLRSGMRARMSVSPLMDATRFTINLECAYRAMWRDWCQGRA